MSLFSTRTAVPDGAALDPTKHVNFTYGMVLGAADFQQEFAYHMSRDQWIALDLIGYGTVSGLRVSIERDAKGPRVFVSPGVAVTPRGELVRVSLAQCAFLNEWLSGDAQIARLQQRGTPASATTDRLDVYVTLCYRSCPTDKVPIPGEPCRTEDESMAPSRQMDDFKLELRWEMPDERDEAAIRDFVDWLARIPIVDGGSSTPLDAFLLEIRKAAFLIGSPPASPPDFMYGTPPALLQIEGNDVCRYLRAAFRLWVTELRPKWGASWWGAAPRCSDAMSQDGTLPEECLLLAHLDVPIVRTSLTAAGWQVSSDVDVAIDEEARPFLAPLRLLQEWLWCGSARAYSGGEGNAFRVDAAVAAAPTATIVAAGTVTVGAPASGPFKLQAATTGTTSEVKVTFVPFPPPAGFDYAVTATAIAGVVKNPRVQFLNFTPDGFVLRVTNSTANASAASLAGLQLMVQVTQHPK
jgi:hypothetical protein